MKIPCYSVVDYLRRDGGYLLQDKDGELMMRSDVETEIARLQAELKETTRAMSAKTKTIRKLRNALNKEGVVNVTLG